MFTRDRIAWILVAIIVLALILPIPVEAVEFSNDSVIGADEVIEDDLFVTAETVDMQGSVNGTLFVNSSSVVVSGEVNGDLFLNGTSAEMNGNIAGNLFFFGQKLTLNGTVQGSVFAAGSVLIVGSEAEIARNLYCADFSLTTHPGSLIGRDVLNRGYSLNHAGTIQRNINYNGSALEISGFVGQDIQAEIDDESDGSFPYKDVVPQVTEVIDPGLRILPGAEILGQLTYTSKVAYDQNIQVQPAGGTQFNLLVQEDAAKPSFKESAQSAFRELISLALLGLVASFALPAVLSRTVKQTQSPLRSIGWGVLFLIAGVFVILILVSASILVGILLGIISLGKLSSLVAFTGISASAVFLMLFLVVLVYGSKLVAATWVGILLFQRLATGFRGSIFWPMLTGIGVYILLNAIPIVGGLVNILATLLGAGAIWLTFKRS